MTPFLSQYKRRKNHKPIGFIFDPVSPWVPENPPFCVMWQYIYISVLRIELFPPLLAVTTKIKPILEVVHDMARCHQVSVICCTLFTNKKHPVDIPFIETKAHYNDLLICEILRWRRVVNIHDIFFTTSSQSSLRNFSKIKAFSIMAPNFSSISFACISVKLQPPTLSPFLIHHFQWPGLFSVPKASVLT